jgi:hypothetical protein
MVEWAAAGDLKSDQIAAERSFLPTLWNLGGVAPTWMALAVQAHRPALRSGFHILVKALSWVRFGADFKANTATPSSQRSV